MTDDQEARILQLQQRIANWEREQAHEIGTHRLTQQRLKDTLSLSWRMMALGSIPSVFWVICWATIVNANETTFDCLLTSAGALAVLSLVAAAAARASGLTAHFWFPHSASQERLAAKCMAALAAAIQFGWVQIVLS